MRLHTSRHHGERYTGEGRCVEREVYGEGGVWRGRYVEREVWGEEAPYEGCTCTGGGIEGVWRGKCVERRHRMRGVLVLVVRGCVERGCHGEGYRYVERGHHGT